MSVVAVAACVVATALAGLRWLRVAQREHYLAGACTRFGLRWWWGLGFNRLLAIGIGVDVLLTFVSPFFALLGAAAVAVGPFGLHLRGTAPGPLRWTRRLRTLAAASVLVWLVVAAIVGLAISPAVGAFVAAVATPLIVDSALSITAPLERRLGQKWVDQAKAKLHSIGPTVVALTGSYGKTTTKGYVRHLVEGSRTVVATPASFNNALGLARSINEHLTPGTEVFVAEMGTYGKGEIASMCEWARPSVSAITAIGPVHLERMRSEDDIAEAKSEILETASVVALNVDDARLAALADRATSAGKTVLRCSGKDAEADVSAIEDGIALVVRRAGNEVARIPLGGDARHVATNVAVAVALAGAAGVPDDAMARRLTSLPTAPNRQSLARGSTGATFIDDTYNSNPAGARAALDTLAILGRDASRIAVVTPGMVELGPRQDEENERFAAAASEVATDIVIMGSTNRRALAAGAHQGRARVVFVDDRAQATAWVRENTGEGDVVLFENDLPDHFP